MYRAFHSRYATQLADTKTVDNVPCAALISMSMIFARVVSDLRPRYLAVAFDAHRRTFRNDLYLPYKQGRREVQCLHTFSLSSHNTIS